MKKLLLSLFVAISSVSASFAQEVTVAEPEFADEVLVVVNNHGTLLPRENAVQKTKASAAILLTGIGKIKSRIYCESPASKVTIDKADRITLIVKGLNNQTDPNSYIGIFKFEVKGDERRYQTGEVGVLTGEKTNGLGSIDYKAKKYGESSYLLVLEDLQPGEYGIYLGDPNALTNKNSFKVTTFGVR